MIVRCLYASRAAGNVTDAVLESILSQSRKNNPLHGITGMLCFANNTFVQVLEGGRSNVSRLFNTIARDERNHDVQILSYGEISQRRFENWTMGRINMASVNPSLLLKYLEVAELDPFNCSSEATLAVLLEIAASGSIINRSG
jgi:hypothetical protein